jgi:hypothetical protein
MFLINENNPMIKPPFCKHVLWVRKDENYRLSKSKGVPSGLTGGDKAVPAVQLRG